MSLPQHHGRAALDDGELESKVQRHDDRVPSEEEVRAKAHGEGVDLRVTTARRDAQS